MNKLQKRLTIAGIGVTTSGLAYLVIHKIKKRENPWVEGYWEKIAQEMQSNN